MFLVYLFLGLVIFFLGYYTAERKQENFHKDVARAMEEEK